MESRPLISVITPAYNAEPYIAATIRSVQAQSISDWEMIIMDDGSRDKTADVIAAFESDPRIRYFRQENAGVSIARNNAMKEAKGKYFALLDADDLFELHNLEKKVLFLENEPGYDWVYSRYYILSPEGGKKGEGPAGSDEDLLRHLFLWDREGIPAPCSNILFRRTLYDRGARFDPELSTTADRCFTVQLALAGRGKYLPDVLFSYRVLPGSMSRNMRVTEKDNIYFYRKYSAMHHIRPWAFRRRCYSNIYLILAGSWNNSGNSSRGILFLIRSFLAWPPQLPKIIYKIFVRNK